MKILKSFAIVFISLAIFLCGCLPEGMDITTDRPTDQPTKKASRRTTNKTSNRTHRTHRTHKKTSTNTSSTTNTATTTRKVAKSASLSNIPPFSGEPYVVINNNKPKFADSERDTKSYEYYSDLDNLGRCQVAISNVGQDLMPTEKRESISRVRPSGWKNAEYDFVDGGHLYNRCHLIGFQLTGENANERNLITGTRYLNVDGMLPFENMISDYVKETNNHVLYKVEPIYDGNDLVAKGLHMQAESVEDNGEGVSFNIYCYNNQPGVKINYATGESELDNSTAKYITPNTKSASSSMRKHNKNRKNRSSNRRSRRHRSSEE